MYNFQSWLRTPLLVLVLGAFACGSDRIPYGLEPGDFVSVRLKGGGGIIRCKVVSCENKSFTFQVIRRKDGAKGFVYGEIVTIEWPRIYLIADIYVDMEG